MTQQQDPPPAASGDYIASLADRLAADGCDTDWTQWEGSRVLVGRRSDKRAGWMWTRVHMFTIAAAVPEVGTENLSRFTSWAMHYAKEHKSGRMPVGSGNVITVFPVLVGDSVLPEAKNWAREDMRFIDLSIAARPVAVDARGAGATLYRGRPLHGRMFVKHTLAKADLYFP
ncbi:levansucrase [Streptomyces fructofermentans]|uniref:levansucrase n=1 Tax=Streptomyces fructofermentans TaxID=152141 RepID=UPI0033FA8CB2